VLRLLFDALLAAAERSPGKTAVVANGVRYSYAELLDACLRLAATLHAQGVRRGDRVAIYLENSWASVVSIYGTLLAGGVLTVINPQTKADKLAYMLADSGARILISDGALAPAFVPAVGQAPDIVAVICAGEAPTCSAPIIAFDAILRDAPASPEAQRPIPIDLAALIYTSGSTGNPKGVMLTHHNMVFAADSIAHYLRLTSDDRILNVLPLAFDYGLYQLLLAVSLGATLVLERSFTFPAAVLDRLRTEDVTVFPLVPTIAATLLALKGDQWVFPGVTRVTNTAAALPDDFIPRLAKMFPRALIFPMYGLTECKRVSYLEPEMVHTRPTSVGKAIPGTEVFLLSPDGEPVRPGEPGVLHVRGPHVMLGYWKQPELTTHMLKPGRYPGERVLCTHDVFTMDDEGYLYFVGRTDDIIKTRGEKVSPIEVENALHRLPGVREAAVIGVPDEILGEAIRAFIVLADGATLTPQDVKKACLATLESFMVPRDVVFVAELPKTSTAKVRKQSLREVVV
jgi:long-chain acyl-CoA synthetase